MVMTKNDLFNSMIGKKVCKTSGKPFKSTFKTNTVTGVIDHPVVLGEKAYTFAEDDSFVACVMCEESI